jgi:hypothetical protein
VFLCKPVNKEREKPSHEIEVLDARWFAEGALPEDIDPGHQSRIPEAFRVWHGDSQVFFDRPATD